MSSKTIVLSNSEILTFLETNSIEDFEKLAAHSIKFYTYLQTKEFSCDSLSNKISDLRSYLEKDYSEHLISELNQNLDFSETISDNISPHMNNLLQEVKKTNIPVNEFCEFYFKSKHNSSLKGAVGENVLEILLTKEFPESEIAYCGNESHCGDFILQRKNKTDILIENKNWTKNVTKLEIEKFVDDIKNTKRDGILVSQKSGISRKKDYEIEIFNNNVVVYIHKCEYDPIKLRTAVNIIDQIKKIYKKNSGIETKIEISSSDLEIINKEYSAFINKKQSLITKTNNYCKTMIDDLNKLNMENLQKLIKENQLH